jgi:hypothetical protein
MAQAPRSSIEASVFDFRPRWRSALRPGVGIAWLAAWCGALWALASPWRQLGGLEPERLRWFEWWALASGVALGFTIGRGALDWARSGMGRTYLMAMRVALYAPGLVTAVALAALSIAGERGPTGVVATAFFSYWAGFDAAFGALPLMERGAHDQGEVRRSWDHL